MCYADCCCRDLKKDGLIRFLFLFTAINILLSVIAIFIRAADCDRYTEALTYLEERNNGTFKNNLIQNCKKSLSILDDDYYCDVDGKKLKKPNDEVNYQSLFKNWKKIEVALNVSRTVVEVLCLGFLYYVLKKKGNNIENEDGETKEKYKGLLSYVMAAFIFLIVVNSLWIMIRALALTANQDIGLYEDGTQNAFESRIAINYIFDIIEIILFSIEICFVLRLKREINKPIPVVIINQPPPQPQPVVVVKEVAIIQEKYIQHPLDNF